MSSKESGEFQAEEPAWKQSPHAPLMETVMDYLRESRRAELIDGKVPSHRDRANQRWLDWMIEEGYTKDREEIDLKGHAFFSEELQRNTD